MLQQLQPANLLEPPQREVPGTTLLRGWVNKDRKIVKIGDAPCCGPRVSYLSCVKGDGKEDVVVSEPIHPEVRIGHAHLKVADLDRATAFYRDVLGFEVMMEMGAEAAFLSAGGDHHQIGLNTRARARR